MSETGIRGNRSIDTGVATRIGKYSDAVEVRAGSRLLYLAGTPGLTADGSLPTGIVAQAEHAWANVIDALDGAGMELSDLVKLTQYVTSVRTFPPMRKCAIGFSGPCGPPQCS